MRFGTMRIRRTKGLSSLPAAMLFMAPAACCLAAPALALDEAAAAADLERHDRAVYVHEQWIRDPYILPAPDGWFYLTGTTLRNEPDSQVGIPAWRSRDLVRWEQMPRLWKPEDSKWISELTPVHGGLDAPLLVWAPEVHCLDGRWVIVHTTNARGANLLLAEGKGLAPPFSEPMARDFGRRHDPSVFTDADGSHWLVYGCATLQKLKSDFSGFDGAAVEVGPSNRKMGHEGCVIRKIGGTYVLFGTAWSTDTMRRGTYNLYYCTADEVTGPYGPRKFAGRFLGHGTPFQDRGGRWWCTAFYNANQPALTDEELATKDLSDTAYTINRQGTTLVPLDIRVVEGDVQVRAKDPRYARPGPEEVQRFD